ncbi:MAG: hypothetical protein HYS32_03260 [Candidatus Woesearchaeota archaeon]|nr:MAG: hypothetical protein HYS32_03260 [Candidatus Woesearchaeota archaeon]
MKRQKKRSNLDNLSSKQLEDLQQTIQAIQDEYNLTKKDIINLIEEKPILIPISIFKNDELSSLELIVRYLKDELNLNYHKIAQLLNRDDRTIWHTYKNSLRKKKEKLTIELSRFSIPIPIFKNRKFSVLEIIVSHLKENYNLRYHKIASLLRKDQRTIWTVYNRYRKKYARQKL